MSVVPEMTRDDRQDMRTGKPNPGICTAKAIRGQGQTSHYAIFRDLIANGRPTYNVPPSSASCFNGAANVPPRTNPIEAAGTRLYLISRQPLTDRQTCWAGGLPGESPWQGSQECSFLPEQTGPSSGKNEPTETRAKKVLCAACTDVDKQTVIA